MNSGDSPPPSCTQNALRLGMALPFVFTVHPSSFRGYGVSSFTNHFQTICKHTIVNIKVTKKLNSENNGTLSLHALCVQMRLKSLARSEGLCGRTLNSKYTQ